MYTFIRIVRLGSISAAARRLKISQPAVTMRIRALENELGVTLIDKVGTQINITPAGRMFYQYALRISQTLQFGLDHIGDASGEMIVLAGNPTLGTYLLPDIYRHFVAAHPESNIIIQVYNNSEKVVDTILDHVADIGLVHGDVDHPQIAKTPLYEEELVLTLHPGHPLCHKPVVDLYDLKQHTLIGYSPNTPKARMIEHMFIDAKISVDITIYTSDVVTMKRMVMENLGVAFLPRLVVSAELQEKRLLHKPIEQPYVLTQPSQLITLKDSFQHDKIAIWKKRLIHYLQSQNLVRAVSEGSRLSQ